MTETKNNETPKSAEAILKQYYAMLYPKKLKDNEYIRLLFVNKDDSSLLYTKFVKNFDEYKQNIDKFRNKCHCYNQLATVIEKNGIKKGEECYQGQRRVLYLDFDLKDFPELKMPDAYTFTDRIKKYFSHLYVHACVFSGGGYHFYIAVKQSHDISKIVSMNGDIQGIVGSDPRANSPTQIVRIPTTFNFKYSNDEGKPEYVKVVYNDYGLNDDDHKPYYEYSVMQSHITTAKRRYKEKNDFISKPLLPWNYTDAFGVGSQQFPCFCTKRVFMEGADKGERNFWLGRILKGYVQQGKQKSFIINNLKHWNDKCRPPKPETELISQIEMYLKNIDKYVIGGCYHSIKDENTRAKIEKYCDEVHCKDSKNKEILITPDTGVKMNKVVLKDSNLSKGHKNSLDGYEYLILTVLSKYAPVESRKKFTIRNLKRHLQYKNKGKWSLCISKDIFVRTLNNLEEKKLIILKDSEENGRNALDDKSIKLTRKIKDFTNHGFIEFYYSCALAFIHKQITETEYRVYLALMRQMQEHESCTRETLSKIVNADINNIGKYLANLELAGVIMIIPRHDENNIPYNVYKMVDTNRWSDSVEAGKESKINTNTIEIVIENVAEIRPSA